MALDDSAIPRVAPSAGHAGHGEKSQAMRLPLQPRCARSEIAGAALASRLSPGRRRQPSFAATLRQKLHNLLLNVVISNNYEMSRNGVWPTGSPGRAAEVLV